MLSPAAPARAESMSYAVVIVETESGERVELALPLDVPARLLAPRVMQGFGKVVRTGESFALYFKTGRGDKLIPPDATLAELGIQDGQRLRIKRQRAGTTASPPRAHAYLRAQSGERLALEAHHVIIGRKDPKRQFPVDLDVTRLDPGQAVSRQHASIGHEGSKYYLRDLDSTNGTRVNGKVVLPGDKMPLKDGDDILLGLQVRFTFLTLEGDTARGQTPKTPDR
jgi:hypothetical protein